MEDLSAFTQPTASSVAQRLRMIRKSRGWTLQEVERRSQGSIKAVVMGSYERGTRAISLLRCIELANLFAIPVTELLMEVGRIDVHNQISKRFDLRRSSELVKAEPSREFLALQKYLLAIAQRRCDWNGEILSLRSTDLDTLTLLLEMNTGDLQNWLKRWKLTLN